MATTALWGQDHHSHHTESVGMLTESADLSQGPWEGESKSARPLLWEGHLLQEGHLLRQSPSPWLPDPHLQAPQLLTVWSGSLWLELQK